MKVLIVNALSRSQTMNRRFQDLIKLIQKVTLTKAFTYQKFIPLSHIEFDIVSLNHLEQYLYEISSPFLSRDALKVTNNQLFDNLDFIFIDGDPNLMPWDHRAFKLQVLVRMCKRTNKLLFGTGSAM